MTTRRYPLSMRIWPGTDAIQVYDVTDRRLCSIPLDSLKGSSIMNWEYILHCVEACVEGKGRLLREGEDVEPPHDTPVLAGKYYYLSNGEMKLSVDASNLYCTADAGDSFYVTSNSLQVGDASIAVRLRRGPFGKQRGRPAPSGTSASASSMSNSKRSTSDQRSLKIELIGRDYTCLVTGEAHQGCTASHIIPYSRSDILEGILGYPDEWPFHVSMGLLLEDKIHHAYDQYDISIYPRSDTEWVVLVFYQDGPNYKQYHGHAFTSQRFRGHPDQWPRRDLLLWQHQQCVQKHYRGYSHQMSADDERVRSAA